MKQIFQKISSKLKNLGIFSKKKKPTNVPEKKTSSQLPDIPELPEEANQTEGTNQENIARKKSSKFSLKKLSAFNIKEKLSSLKSTFKNDSKKSKSVSKIFQAAMKKSEGLRNKLKKTKGGKKFFNWFSSIKWRNITTNFLSPSNRPKIHRFFMITILLISTYNIGKVFGYFLKGDSDLKPVSQVKTLPAIFPHSLAAHKRIFKRNIFNIKDDSGQVVSPKLADKKKKPTGPCLKARTASKLKIELLDTIVLQDSVKSIASVQVRGGGEVKHIREGEKIDNLAKIGKISRLEIVFRNLKSGACEKVLSKDAKNNSSKKFEVVSPQRGKKLLTRNVKAGVKNEGNTFTIPKKSLDAKLKNINQVLTQAKAIKITNDDGSLAFKLTNIVPGSIYTELGFQNGDIIKSINNEKIKNLNAIFNLFGNIRNVSELQLKVSRNGQDSDFQYKIAK